jgi:hypothetical protein
MNPFSAINFNDLKNTYNNAIDALIDQTGLSLPCKFYYTNNDPTLCSNCVFDHITQKSANTYNGTGPAPFPSMGICPVCNGNGFNAYDNEEIIYLSVILDSKYWFNWNNQKSNPVHVPGGSIQTICKSSLLPKIRNASKIFVDISKENYGSYFYIRSNDPELAGFGDLRYVFTIWNRA